MLSFDEYIPETEEHKQSPGLYKVYQDGEGTRKIEFSIPSSGKPVSSVKISDKYELFTDTDNMADKIGILKEKQKELRRQFNSETNPVKAEELQKELNAVENKLQLKDDDTYHHQNAQVITD